MEATTGSSPGLDPGCGLCLAERAPYTCPRCHLRFCSVPCYRGHGSCAQDFQNRELQLRLQSQRRDPASRRRLAEALLRLRELREPGDADLPLGLDPEEEQGELDELWGQLSPAQRKAFQRLLHSGEISALLPPWRPWWTWGSRGAAALIQELGEPPMDTPQPPLRQQEQLPQGTEALHRPTRESSTSSNQALQPAGVSNSAPVVPTTIPPLASLIHSPISPLVRFQLPSMLYAYAYAMALYNGDGDELLPEFCETVLDVSGALGARQVFHSTAEALQAALQAITAGRYPECPLGNAGVMVAVAQILMGECQEKQKGYTLAALAHLSRLLSKGKRRLPAEDQSRVYGAKKKCEFLLSWVNENEEALTLLALEVQQEYKVHLDTLKEVGAVTQELEKMWAGKVPPAKKPLIQELD
ncbi:zinc finger HIT domain-containing protein 2 [Hemicordylus capensis]|uniref:zinc finger HIT domain-containing protein 2 n=1 Tax=Hemicordylus capensis TaxID=884348 RepID=UPI0023034D83|nr:zinc finger HIT domain-containing protein 2 [Hemicordylus capensis]